MGDELVVLSVVDLGSNALRLRIFATDLSGNRKLLQQKRWPVRLGDDVFETGRISETKIQICLIAFQEILELHKKHKGNNLRAVATSALRDAENSLHLIQLVDDQLNIKIKIIDGESEGHLIHRAVSQYLSQDSRFKTNSQSVLLMDVGGGSVELSHSGSKADSKMGLVVESYPLGSVRLLKGLPELRKDSDLELSRRIQSFEPTINRFLKSLAISNEITFIGTGGNIDILLDLSVDHFSNPETDSISCLEIQVIWEELRRLSFEERIAKFDLAKERADVLLPAIEVSLLILKLANLERMFIPGVGLGEGLILESEEGFIAKLNCKVIK